MDKKITYLDGLRGVAAFIVVITHFAALFYVGIFTGTTHTITNMESRIRNSFVYVFFNGTFAVCIFFVLSGFVLSYKFFLTQDRIVIREGLIRRYFRLVVPVAFSIIVAFLMMKLHLIYSKQVALVTFTNWDQMWNFIPTIWDMIKEIFFRSFFTYAEGKYNFALWTMCYEFIGSFIVFITLFVVSHFNIKLRFLFYTILIIVFFKTYFFGFIVGIAICDYEHNIDHKFLKNQLLNIVLFIFSILIGAFAHKFNFQSARLEQIYLVIAGCMTVFSLINSRILQRIFSLKLFVWLGKISFSMYIIHVLILASFSSYLFLRMLEHYPNYNVIMFLTIIITLPIIFVVSHIMYKYVDMNGVKFSKFMYILVLRIASRVFGNNLFLNHRKATPRSDVVE